MEHKFSIRKIWAVARTEWIKWVVRSRTIILLVLVLFVYSFAVEPLLERADKMGAPLNLLEPLIAIGNSGVLALVLPLVFLVLMCDYPRVDGSTLFVLSRVGKGNWIVGQMVFGVMSVVSFLGAVYIICTAFVMSKAFLANGWSMVIKRYNALYPEEALSFASTLVPGNLHNQFAPYSALLHTYVLLSAYFLVLILILLYFQQKKYPTAGFLAVGGVIGVGAVLMGVNTKAMWAFPMANALVWLHYTELLKEAVTPIWYSYLYFAILIVALVIMNLIAVRHTNIDMPEEL